MSIEFLQSMSKRTVIKKDEEKVLRIFASKVTKLPDKIVIPREYLEDEK